jgi:hypothetical protein
MRESEIVERHQDELLDLLDQARDPGQTTIIAPARAARSGQSRESGQRESKETGQS